MTLIIGLKSDDCVVLAAEQEESAGIAAKRTVNKMKLLAGDDWAIIFGAAGDATVGENAMRRLENKFLNRRGLTADDIQDALDDVLDTVHRKYIDPDKNPEGISLVVGASCGDELHLISTLRRTPQFQDLIAYAGIGSDVALYFLDRIHYSDFGWKYTTKVAAYVLAQVKESAQACSGASQMFALQSPPNPRWRDFGEKEAWMELENSFRFEADIADILPDILKKIRFPLEGLEGYSDEHHPEPLPHKGPFEGLGKNKGGSGE
jgi:20S proteasome alpha/beta subunit